MSVVLFLLGLAQIGLGFVSMAAGINSPASAITGAVAINSGVITIGLAAVVEVLWRMVKHLRAIEAIQMAGGGSPDTRTAYSPTTAANSFSLAEPAEPWRSRSK